MVLYQLSYLPMVEAVRIELTFLVYQTSALPLDDASMDGCLGVGPSYDVLQTSAYPTGSQPTVLGVGIGPTTSSSSEKR